MDKKKYGWMNKKKLGLELERHIELGKVMKPMGDFLVCLSVEISNSHGKNKKVSKIASDVQKQFSRLKSELENEMFKIYPESSTDVYYGDRDNTILIKKNGEIISKNIGK